MNDPAGSRVVAGPTIAGVAARCALGCAMIYFGLGKAANPVDFLKILREYGLTQNPWLLNSVAALLPWLEVVCGALLLGGIAVRGTAVVTGVLLVAFTLVVSVRAVAMHQAGDLPFCAIKFNCGCGSGEVMICRKLLENGALILSSILACTGPAARFCLRHQLVRSPSPAAKTGDNP